MRNKLKVFTSLLIMAGVFGWNTSVFAGDVLSNLWVMDIKEGQFEEFEEALKKHMAYRQKKGDPWAWQTYTPSLGKHLNRVGVRACCFEWADLDKYQKVMEDSDIQEHFTKNVDKYVARYEHYYNKMHVEESNWPENITDPTMVGISSYYIKPGGYGAIMAGMKKMTTIAKEGGWPNHWSWSSVIGGKPVLQLVTPHDNFASLKSPDQSFMEFLAEKLGSEDDAMKLMEGFASGYSHSTFNLYRHRPDLSMAQETMVAKK